MATDNTNRQGKYWLLTIRAADWEPTLPPSCCYVKGQKEEGEGGFIHWQVLACFTRKARLRAVKDAFGPTAHAELSRSNAANEYVWKEETRIAGTQFELGNKNCCQ